MKKIIITLLVLLIFSSCSQLIISGNYANLSFNNADEILQYIEDNFEYCLDWNSFNPSLNNWQSPQETLLLGTGDCDDFTIFFMYYYYLTTGNKCDMYLIELNGGLHYYAVFDGTIYDATTGQIMNYDTAYKYNDINNINIYSYDEIFLDI